MLTRPGDRLIQPRLSIEADANAVRPAPHYPDREHESEHHQIKAIGIDSITVRDSVFGAVTVPLNAIAPLLHRHFLAVLAPARVERAFGIETPVGVGAKIVAQTLEQVGRPA